MAKGPTLLTRFALGLGAGLLGATAMLVSQKIEIRATGRKPSDTPAKAVETLTGLTARDEERRSQLSTAAHFAFGTALGAGLVALDRVPTPFRTPLFAAGAWLVGTGVLVALDVSDPPTEWSAGALATDIGHHAVYAASASAAYGIGRRLVAD